MYNHGFPQSVIAFRARYALTHADTVCLRLKAPVRFKFSKHI